MDIERASAKIRARGVVDEKEDYALPVYAERIPVITVLGQARALSTIVGGSPASGNTCGLCRGSTAAGGSVRGLY